MPKVLQYHSSYKNLNKKIEDKLQNIENEDTKKNRFIKINNQHQTNKRSERKPKKQELQHTSKHRQTTKHKPRIK